MLRRLYFVLPDASRTAGIVDELRQSGITDRRMALASRRAEPAQIAGITVRSPHHDAAARAETALWNLNLMIFFAALAAMIVMLAAGTGTAWLGLPLLVMAATFFAGERFTHIPNTHLQEFAAALRHGEVVLMVDVPPDRVAEIESLVHSRHPDAAVGGVGWSTDLLPG